MPFDPGCRRPTVKTFIALLVHGLAYGGGVWVIGFARHSAHDWAVWYVIGAAALVLVLTIGQRHINPARALKILFFAALIAVWFWGANVGLDALGNSVAARRTPSHLQEGLPLHFILVPGVASVALALVASTLVRRT
jgi:hypothetical protein